MFIAEGAVSSRVIVAGSTFNVRLVGLRCDILLMISTFRSTQYYISKLCMKVFGNKRWFPVRA